MPRRAPRITLRLSSTSTEERTRFLLEGTLPTALPPPALHQLLSLLVYWSGRRPRVPPGGLRQVTYARGRGHAQR